MVEDEGAADHQPQREAAEVGEWCAYPGGGRASHDVEHRDRTPTGARVPGHHLRPAPAAPPLDRVLVRRFEARGAGRAKPGGRVEAVCGGADAGGAPSRGGARGVNARPRPLAFYYFGDDGDRRTVLDRTTSGNVTVNGTIMHIGQDDLPFGGVGDSGIGKYHGIEGFRTLSHTKGVYVQGRWNAIRLLYAPFGKRADRILDLALR